MKLWELARALPGAFRASSAGKSVREHYAKLVGPTNYQRALSPMLTAVPSQPADDLPADMLFKKRPRRKDVIRSFTLRGGLGVLAPAVARLPGVTLATGRAATRVVRAGAGFRVETSDGRREEAPAIAIAVPPAAAARLLGDVLPEASAVAASLREATVDSTGVIVRAEKVPLPYATFFIPVADRFYSVVTRDVVADPTWRGFVFHFRPGIPMEERVDRIVKVLRVAPKDLELTLEKRHVMPSPIVGHAAAVAELDRALAGQRIAVCGNWFTGLALEDCTLRARAEWIRVGAGAAAPQRLASARSIASTTTGSVSP
jgi:protoporphyrinogen oxidase